MRAVVRQGKGLVYSEVKTPSPPTKPEEVLVKIGAAAINPVDYKAPKMLLGPIAGLDFAGIIEAVASRATHDFKVGDAVYGTTKGSLCERAICKVAFLSKAPSGLSMVQAAAMPTTYLTSHQALTTYGKLKEGGRVLVIGASGGCGTAGLQLARQMGAAEIVAVCSGRNADYARSHGATRVVDYTTEDLAEVYSNAKDEDKFDVVYDCATNSGGGEDYHALSLPLLCKGDADGRRANGQYVAINGATAMWLRKFTIGQKANQHLFLTDANTTDLAHLAKLAEDKAIVPAIDATFPFTAEGADASHQGLDWPASCAPRTRLAC